MVVHDLQHRYLVKAGDALRRLVVVHEDHAEGRHLGERALQHGPDPPVPPREAGFEKALIVGGNGAVSDETQDYLETTLGIKVMRLSGSNRYKTSAEIIRWELGMKEDALFQPAVLMTNAGMGVATGENFADALASVSLLGKNGSVLLLANGQKLALLQESVDDFIKPYVKEMEKGYIFGGDNAVSPEIESLLNAAIE